MRGYWQYEITEGWDVGDSVEITLTEQGVKISVTQEKAVNSYNETFTCSVVVPFDKLSGATALLAIALARGTESGAAIEVAR